MAMEPELTLRSLLQTVWPAEEVEAEEQRLERINITCISSLRVALENNGKIAAEACIKAGVNEHATLARLRRYGAEVEAALGIDASLGSSSPDRSTASVSMLQAFDMPIQEFLQKLRPADWSDERLKAIKEKLILAEIACVVDLDAALADGGRDLNSKLRQMGLKTFGRSTLDWFQERVKVMRKEAQWRFHQIEQRRRRDQEKSSLTCQPHGYADDAKTHDGVETISSMPANPQIAIEESEISVEFSTAPANSRGLGALGETRECSTPLVKTCISNPIAHEDADAVFIAETVEEFMLAARPPGWSLHKVQTLRQHLETIGVFSLGDLEDELQAGHALLEEKFEAFGLPSLDVATVEFFRQHMDRQHAARSRSSQGRHSGFLHISDDDDDAGKSLVQATPTSCDTAKSSKELKSRSQEHASSTLEASRTQDFASCEAAASQAQEHASGAAETPQTQEHASGTAEALQTQDLASSGAETSQSQNHETSAAEALQTQEHASSAAEASQTQEQHASSTAEASQIQDHASSAAEMCKTQEYASRTAEVGASQNDVAAEGPSKLFVLLQSARPAWSAEVTRDAELQLSRAGVLTAEELAQALKDTDARLDALDGSLFTKATLNRLRVAIAQQSKS